MSSSVSGIASVSWPFAEGVIKSSIDKKAIPRKSELPGVVSMVVDETVTLLFPNLSALRTTLRQPISIEDDLVDQVVEKLDKIVGTPIYPSQLARLIFELCYLDMECESPAFEKLTDSICQIFSNLSMNDSGVEDSLNAFYNGFSMQHLFSIRVK